ncbi:hypothetical protein OF829_19750 [Sphingomonas sp. LB-2]|uniref:hypothetical protein n=1 Tax=Sphingomonas caeni TaxID=2984949 RepID=UPI0022312452|nr:hypothetical protein [Sphingomonas caeni]MCW3849478.1 hypothetical protein [Sphingomonas caeni]
MFLAALLLAQTAPQQQCAAMDVNLPAELSMWTAPPTAGPTSVPHPFLLPARPKAEVAGVPAGAKEGGVATLAFRIDSSGLYAIAIDQGAWIDVVPDGGAPSASVKHGHGPECSTIRKIVHFELKPGRYTIYVSGLTVPTVKLLLDEIEPRPQSPGK